MKSSKSSKSTPKTTESSWTVDSTDIVRTRSKSLVKGGPNGIDKADLSSELDAFRLFWNEKIEKGLLEYNNKKNGANFVTLEDFRRYICISLVMGIVHFPNQRDHWNDSEFFGTKFVQQLMTRISWESTHSSLHFDIKFLRENLTTTNFQHF